jgi:hypothetical protein
MNYDLTRLIYVNYIALKLIYNLSTAGLGITMSVTALIESIEIPCAITRRAPIIITTMPLASPNNCSHATQAAAHIIIN